jgi:hypothetical protein
LPRNVTPSPEASKKTGPEALTVTDSSFFEIDRFHDESPGDDHVPVAEGERKLIVHDEASAAP